MIFSAEGLFKITWYSHHIKISLTWNDCFIIAFELLFVFDAIARMFHLQILEVLLNIVEIFFVTHRYVVDIVGKIEVVALVFELLDDVLIWVGSDVDVSWYSIGSNVSYHVAPLFIIHFFFGPLIYISSKLVFFHDGFFADFFSVGIESVFVKELHHIGFMGPKHILLIK